MDKLAQLKEKLKAEIIQSLKDEIMQELLGDEQPQSQKTKSENKKAKPKIRKYHEKQPESPDWIPYFPKWKAVKDANPSSKLSEFCKEHKLPFKRFQGAYASSNRRANKKKH